MLSNIQFSQTENLNLGTFISFSVGLITLLLNVCSIDISKVKKASNLKQSGRTNSKLKQIRIAIFLLQYASALHSTEQDDAVAFELTFSGYGPATAIADDMVLYLWTACLNLTRDTDLKDE